MSLVAEDMNFDSLDDLISSGGLRAHNAAQGLEQVYAVLHPEMLYRNVAETPSVKETQGSGPQIRRGLAFRAWTAF